MNVLYAIFSAIAATEAPIKVRPNRRSRLRGVTPRATAIAFRHRYQPRGPELAPPGSPRARRGMTSKIMGAANRLGRPGVRDELRRGAPCRNQKSSAVLFQEMHVGHIEMWVWPGNSGTMYPSFGAKQTFLAE